MPPAGWSAPCNQSVVAYSPAAVSSEVPAGYQNPPVAAQGGLRGTAFQAVSPVAQTNGFQAASNAPFPTDASQGPAYNAPGSPTVPPSPSSALPRQRESTELWLGKYVASIIAAVLVFLGLVLFGDAVLPQLSDEARLVIMFAVSGSLAAVGSVLELRRGNGLTLALMCCGILSLFASALATRSSFGPVPEAVAFAVIFASMTARLLVGCKQKGQDGQPVPETQKADRHFRVLAIGFVSLVAAYVCTFDFWLFSLNHDVVGMALLGASYVVMLGGFGALLLRLMRASSTGVVGYAVGCTVLLMSYLHCCTPLAVEGYTWSVCCMACALVCAAIGFRVGIGGLRLYGLILTLVCVVKLVMIDITGLNELEHAAAFMVGGLICFGISALYHYAVKRLSAA